MFHVAAVDANNRLPPCNGDIAKAILRIQLPYGETSHGTIALHSFLRSTKAAVRNVFTQPQGGPQLVTNAVITPLNSLLNMGLPGVF